MKAFTPIILIGIAIGLFFWQINPTYEKVKEMRAEGAEYDKALSVAGELEDLRAELNALLDSFSQTDLGRLETFLPNHVDNIRMILDINGIASKYNITPRDIKTGDVVASGSGSNQKAYNVASLGFTFNSSYSNATNFLRDLEKSLRLTDIRSLDIKSAESGKSGYDFTVSLNSYWVPKK